MAALCFQVRWDTISCSPPTILHCASPLAIGTMWHRSEGDVGVSMAKFVIDTFYKARLIHAMDERKRLIEVDVRCCLHIEVEFVRTYTATAERFS